MNPPFKNYSLNFRDNINLARKYNDYLESLTNKNNQHFCKLSSYIKPIEYNFIDDAHFTPLGSEKVANYIFQCVEEFMKG